MRSDIPETVTSGIKIAIVDFLRSGGETTTTTTNQAESGGVKHKRQLEKSFLKDAYQIFLGEFIGTALLMFLGCMGCISSMDTPPPTHHMGSLAFGLVVMLLIQVFGHISGAHFNPGVTIASCFLGYIKLSMVPVYFLAEFGGAISGFGLLTILIPSDLISTNETATGLCSTVPVRTTKFQALTIEIIITAVLILVCAAVWDKRNADKPDSTPLRFGFVITVIGMAAGPFTGASMNTARSLAPAIFNNNWSGHWIYWVGPTLGALAGAAIYKILFTPQEIEEGTEDIMFEEATAKV